MELWRTMGEQAAQLMQSRAGLNGYTQGSKRKYFWGYPDNEVGNTSQAGYSDCSSAARSAILGDSGRGGHRYWQQHQRANQEPGKGPNRP